MTTVHRWRIGWGTLLTVGSAVFTWVDLGRERDDIRNGRSHIDGTTLSCFIRWCCEVIPGFKYLFIAFCIFGPGWFLAHILRRLRR